MVKRATVLAALEDMISGFLYYDRKEDDNLPLGAIEEAITRKKLTMDEMTQRFRDALQESVEIWKYGTVKRKE